MTRIPRSINIRWRSCAALSSACSRVAPPSSKAVVEAILDDESQLLEPQELHPIGEAKPQFPTDRVIDLPVDYAEPVAECVHSLSPIDVKSIGRLRCRRKEHVTAPGEPDAVRHRSCQIGQPPEGPGPQHLCTPLGAKWAI